MTFGKMGATTMMYHGILPAGARWVEYLENTDNSYIDTGVYGDSDLDYEITFSSVTNTSSYPYAFGSQISDSEARFSLMFGGPWNGITSVYLNNGNNEKTVSFSPMPSMLTVEKTKLNYYFDGVLKGSFTNNTYITPSSILLFACNGNDSVKTGQRMHGKIHSLKFSRNSVIIRDFHPIAIGTTGYMLDLLTGEYLQYGNKGTGDFVIGPDISAPAIGGGVIS